jgi:hypothetical protein
MNRSWLALFSTVVAFILSGTAHAALVTRPQARAPLSDPQAARLVHRSAWEPRSDNGATRHRMPARAQLREFWTQSQMPYSHWVTGHFTGTTDEIIQWAAIKWGFSPDLLRAVAATESWWKMSTVGDNGDSFGLFQVRRPYHCQGRVCGWFRNDAALNADYYGAILRSYYDGVEAWLNTVSGNGARYRSHDLWGSVGAWYSGRWRDVGAQQYIAKVRSNLRQRVWRTSAFAGGN